MENGNRRSLTDMSEAGYSIEEAKAEHRAKRAERRAELRHEGNFDEDGEAFKKAFEERTGHQVELFNPLNRMQPSSKYEPDYLDEVGPALGVGLGLAMRRVDG